MLKAYKYRIYPNIEQQIYIAKTCGCSRFILMPLARTPVISIMGWIATTCAKSINRLTLANKLYYRLKLQKNKLENIFKINK